MLLSPMTGEGIRGFTAEGTGGSGESPCFCCMALHFVAFPLWDVARGSSAAEAALTPVSGTGQALSHDGRGVRGFTAEAAKGGFFEGHLGTKWDIGCFRRHRCRG